MAKVFDFQWQIAVPAALLRGTVFDRLDEVRLVMITLKTGSCRRLKYDRPMKYLLTILVVHAEQSVCVCLSVSVHATVIIFELSNVLYSAFRYASFI